MYYTHCLALFLSYSFLYLKYFWKRAVLTKPTYTGIGDIKQFGDYMYYQISTLTKEHSSCVIVCRFDGNHYFF
jgi:hypothetical protein